MQFVIRRPLLYIGGGQKELTKAKVSTLAWELPLLRVRRPWVRGGTGGDFLISPPPGASRSLEAILPPDPPPPLSIDISSTGLTSLP